jgi:hypothetical protein
VDCGVDNDADPNENDGKVYELSAPTGDAAAAAAMTEPSEGSTVWGTVTIRASATGDRGVAPQFLVDGAAVGTDTDGADGWSIAWDSIAVADGSDTLGAVATDTLGAVASDTGPADLVPHAEASDNAPALTTTKIDLTSRPTTSASPNWVPAPWPTVGARGADQRTVGLAPVPQQIVDRSGWSFGGALVPVIRGSGTRVVESFDGTFAPVPHVQYTAG